MRCAAGMICVLYLVCIVAAVQIVEFCPDPYQPDDADEYLVISGTGSLDGITISDGRGGFRFPPGTTLGGTLTVARSGTAFEQSHGRPSDFEWLDSSRTIPDVIGGDPLRMTNSGDTLMLYDKGKLVQQVAWPKDVHPREGQIHYLENGSWDPRPLMIGQSRFTPAVFSNVSVTTFISPDCSSEIFLHAINEASGEILLNAYEFSSPAMGDMLIRARERGVNVTVLLEGGPVGGISTEEKSILWKMSGHAITVSAMLPRKGEHAPYRYDHAKYVVIDRSAVLVTSENFKYSGFPPEGMTGNRGWGVYLENPKVARYFSDVFSTDAKSRSVVPFTGSPGNFEPEPERKYMAEFAPGRYEGATVRPVISPDTSFQITDLVNSAGQSIDIEQAYIKNETAYTLNPYLSAAVNASRRGVHVRVLLDSYYYNIEDENDNDEMAALINRIGTGENIPLEARCADLSAQTVDKIHNKGMIVDGRYTLVSSINWNYNSPNFNREAGVIIDHSGIARYFGDVFEDDWKSSITIPETKTDYVKITVIGGVIALLVLVYYYRHVR